MPKRLAVRAAANTAIERTKPLIANRYTTQAARTKCAGRENKVPARKHLLATPEEQLDAFPF